MAPSNSSDLKSKKFWLALIGELLGTFFLVLVACGSCSRTAIDVDDESSNTTDARRRVVKIYAPAGPVQIALSFGLSVGTIVWAIAHVSGGHINPAVTFGFLVTRKVSFARAASYVVVQSVGAVAGAGVLRILSPDGTNDGLGNSSPGNGASMLQVFLIEMLITYVLVFTVFATCDSQRADLRGSGPLAIGLSITMCHLWAIPLSGSGMNPARVLGPAFVSGLINHNHWVYWIGPLIGGAIAGLSYDLLFAVNAGPDKLKGFLKRHYDDSQYTEEGFRLQEPELTGISLKEAV